MRLPAVFLFALTTLSLSMVGPAKPAECRNEAPCQLQDGEYYIHLPPEFATEQPRGAILFLHGYRGKALNEIRNKRFKAVADELGVAFVAVNGVKGTWSFPSSPRDYRNEFEFFDEVLTDLRKRFGVDRTRTMLSGFSSGGFMTWYTACHDARLFGGYAPIAGAFWKPEPTTCPSAQIPYLFHVHGTSDKVVPMEGRPLGGGRWHQGDVHKSMNVWLRQAGVSETKPQESTYQNLDCETWRPEEGLLELCLHTGGHSIKADWIKRAWLRLNEERSWSKPIDGRDN